MKKNENHDFSIPRRQSYAAILLIAYRLYKILFRQLFPFLVIFLLGGSLNSKSYLIWVVCGAAVLGFIYSVFSFFKYYFYLKDEKLIVNKGVLKRSIVEIPFDRIQSINFEQNVLHRIFNVVRLNMDTAGSNSNELQLNALDYGMATQLSNYILAHKSETNSLDDADSEHKSNNKQIIFSLSISQLLKVGITANHLRSGFIIIFFFLTIWENLQEIGMDINERIEEHIPSAQELILGSLVLMFSLFILFFVASFLFSLVRTVLKYYKLQMYRLSDGFVIESGLLNRREYAAKDNKIQLMIWSQNWLQSFIRIFDLSLKQASSIEVSERKSLQLAGLKDFDVDATRKFLFGEYDSELKDIELEGVHPYYRFRRIYYSSLFFIPALSFSILAQRYDLSLLLGLGYSLALYGAQLNYSKKKFGLSENLFRLEGGTFGLKATVLKLSKVQNVTITSTPFQRRRDLCSITFHTASGSIGVPDINKRRCIELNDILIYKVESSHESWM